MTRLKIAVIGGGANAEHTVSLSSAASVVAAIDSHRYDVISLTIDRNGEWLDVSGSALGVQGAVETLRSCDLIFPMVHGRRGEDGTLAALCESIGVAYVGSGVEAGAIGMNKQVTKLVAQSIGINTAPGVLLTRTTAQQFTFTRPVVVKPNSAGSSVGVSLVQDASALPEAIDLALASDSVILVEDVVVGREVDIAVLRHPDGSLLVSPPLEIIVDGLFDEHTKYSGEADFRIPAAVDEKTRLALEAAATRLYDELGCSGVARVDFFVTANEIVLNEINTTPGFTAQSQVPRMYAHLGIQYAQLVDLLICEALGARTPAITSLLQTTGQ